MPLQLKIETIAKEMYGAKFVEFSENVLNKLNTFESKVSMHIIDKILFTVLNLSI